MLLNVPRIQEDLQVSRAMSCMDMFDTCHGPQSCSLAIKALQKESNKPPTVMHLLSPVVDSGSEDGIGILCLDNIQHIWTFLHHTAMIPRCGYFHSCRELQRALPAACLPGAQQICIIAALETSMQLQQQCTQGPSSLDNALTATDM